MVDVPEQIAAVTRALRSEEVDGESSHVQTLVQEYPAGIDDVWDAATTAERIAQHTGQNVEQIHKDSDRDRWFTAEEAREYGIIDKVITRRGQMG